MHKFGVFALEGNSINQLIQMKYGVYKRIPRAYTSVPILL